MNRRNYGDSLVNLVGLQKQLLPKNPATPALVGCQSWEVQKIMRIIISKQKKFFTSQGKKINTLKISDIANELNLSSSTVSRAVKEKYIKTDFGIISLRKLFNLDSAVFLHQQKILEYIENENKEKPFSDQDIVNLLEKDGIKIARRTVTKYREKLGYKSSHERKKY